MNSRQSFAYYNEIDPGAAAWLRELINEGLIAPGLVDERSIEDVQPDDLRPFRQCHFFAGIGGWSYALRLAGWPDDEPVWTGSCPCQFKSSAARGRNTAPDLWPEFRRLIISARPRVVFGEQVASAVAWYCGVRNDLDLEGYSVGGAIIPACSVGKDHARERIYFACHTDRKSQSGLPVNAEVAGVQRADGDGRRDALPHGIPGIVGRKRGYGNAIVPQVAAQFVSAYMESVA